MFFTLGQPRYLEEGPNSATSHLRLAFFPPSFLFPLLELICITQTLISVSCHFSVTVDKDRFAGCSFYLASYSWQIGELCNLSCAFLFPFSFFPCLSLIIYFFFPLILQRCFAFPRVRTEHARYTNYHCEETEESLMMKQQGLESTYVFVCVYGGTCSCASTGIVSLKCN